MNYRSTGSDSGQTRSSPYVNGTITIGNQRKFFIHFTGQVSQQPSYASPSCLPTTTEQKFVQATVMFFLNFFELSFLIFFKISTQ